VRNKRRKLPVAFDLWINLCIPNHVIQPPLFPSFTLHSVRARRTVRVRGTFRNNLLLMPIQLKPKEIQAFKRHLEDLGLPSVATYRAWCQDHGFDPAVKKHWRDRRQEQLAARRMGTKDEDEDALKAHIAALGLDSTSEYQIWCRTNGFSGKLYKTPSQRVQERRMLGQLRRQAQQAGSLRHTRKTGTIEQIYAGDLDGEHPAHPYLHIIHNHFQTLRAADQPDIADAYLALPQPDFTMKGRTVDSMLELVEDRHGEKLAEMWNDSDGEWPGTWTSGMPMTAQNIRDWQDREEYLTVNVWDAGDKIAGYCSLIHKEDEDEVVYLPLLNVSPHFQGKSLGRKILVNAVEKTIDEKK